MKDSRTHFLIFYSGDAGTYVTTTPRLWAHANPQHFPGENNPRTSRIERYLVENFRFRPATTDHTKVLYNFATEIPIGINGMSFYN